MVKKCQFIVVWAVSLFGQTFVNVFLAFSPLLVIPFSSCRFVRIVLFWFMSVKGQPWLHTSVKLVRFLCWFQKALLRVTTEQLLVYCPSLTNCSQRSFHMKCKGREGDPTADGQCVHMWKLPVHDLLRLISEHMWTLTVQDWLEHIKAQIKADLSSNKVLNVLLVNWGGKNFSSSPFLLSAHRIFRKGVTILAFFHNCLWMQHCLPKLADNAPLQRIVSWTAFPKMEWSMLSCGV